MVEVMWLFDKRLADRVVSVYTDYKLRSDREAEYATIFLGRFSKCEVNPCLPHPLHEEI